MTLQRRTRGWRAVVVSALAAIWVATGCGTHSNPTSPSALPSPIGWPTPPVAGPAGPAPTILSVTPSVGSTGGGSWIRIDGTGLVRGIQVTLGTATVSARFDPRYTDRIFLDTPSHAPGVVDVVVTNPDRQSGRAEGAYTFALPGSFDVDGEWGGYVLNDLHDWVTFTVAANSVVSISCGDSGVLVLSAPAPVHDGAFSHVEGTGVSIAGRMVARGQAVGRVNIDRCTNTDWRAEPRPPGTGT